MAKRHCPQCGAKIGETAAFCILCGAQLEPEQMPAPTPAPVENGSIGSTPAGRWSASSPQAPCPAALQQASRQAMPSHQPAFSVQQMSRIEPVQTFMFAKPIDTTWITVTIDLVRSGMKYEDCRIAEAKFQ